MWNHLWYPGLSKLNCSSLPLIVPFLWVHVFTQGYVTFKMSIIYTISKIVMSSERVHNFLENCFNNNILLQKKIFLKNVSFQCFKFHFSNGQNDFQISFFEKFFHLTILKILFFSIFPKDKNIFKAVFLTNVSIWKFFKFHFMHFSRFFQWTTIFSMQLFFN